MASWIFVHLNPQTCPQCSPDHKDYIDDYANKFKVMRELKLMSFTTKSHIILHHIAYYMSETGLSLYTADTSPQESTHSGFKQNQKVHNLLSMHQLGSLGQQQRLKRSMMRHNWKNLSFDLRERQSDSEDPAPLTLQPEEELEDLDTYIQGEAEVTRVEETEVETFETVKQVLRIIFNCLLHHKIYRKTRT